VVPNLANIAKNHCFPKNLPTFFGNLFYCQKFWIFEKPIVTFNMNKNYQILTKTLESTHCTAEVYRIRISGLESGRIQHILNQPDRIRTTVLFKFPDQDQDFQI